MIPPPGHGPRLDRADHAAIDRLLGAADRALARDHAGDHGPPPPVHTVYVPADRVSPTVVADYGAAARAALDHHAPDPSSFAAVVGADPHRVAEVWPRLLAKLDREPVEDLRIDLEDGYRGHTDAEEDADTLAAVAALTGPGAPHRWGIRFASLEPATRSRGLRTLDLAVGATLEAGPVPEGFRLTLPKVSSVDQVVAMVEICRRLERTYEIAEGQLGFEVQIETPRAVLGEDGTATVARLISASDGRCQGLHFGTYDYTTALGISPDHQAMDHPVADHAKQVMLLAAAGTGVPVSDGSTNRLPVGSTAEVHAGWALHYRLVSRSLERGLYQGWDLHPAQLPTRFLATFLFFRAALPGVGRRLRNYRSGAEGSVADEPATARALVGFVRRGLRCGAVTADEATTATGLTPTMLDALAREL